MKFTIENGEDICAIGVSDIGSYIRFNYPLTVAWYDYGGSIAQYVCALPYNADYRNTLAAKITSSLHEDFTDRTAELYELLKPLFPLFKNGDYNLDFFSDKDNTFFNSSTWYVMFAQHVTEIHDVESVKANYRAFLDEKKEHARVSVLDFSTSNSYPNGIGCFATQPQGNIDQNRVTYFEEELKTGKRPLAILFHAELTFIDESSSYFILDGHHKLLAYQNLGLYPPIAVLTHLPKTLSEVEFDIGKLSEVLFPWQTQHILDHWQLKGNYIERSLAENPNSPLHLLIKNGDYKEYHDNGKLSYQAFYINDKIEGSAKRWSKNGRLKSLHNYTNGIRTGISEDYYESGKIEYIQSFNSNGQLHGIIKSYHENGQQESERHMENGWYAEGLSYKWWFENGKKKFEFIYKNGTLSMRKDWNKHGKLISHEVYNEETKQLDKIPIPADTSFLNTIKRFFRKD